MSTANAFGALPTHGRLRAADLTQWNAIVGLCDRRVHNCLNVDMAQVLERVAQERDRARFVVGFCWGGE